MSSTDATKHILGFTFQKLMALEKCFDAPVNTSIWMEYFGDISDGKTSTEVKHHSSDHNLSSNSPDFWKTLHNLINDRELLSDHNEFCLLTTSTVPDTSIFQNWNEKTAPQKYKTIKEHEPTEGVKKYHSAITSDPKSAKKILSNFSIISELPTVGIKWGLLQEHAILNFAADDLKEAALGQALILLDIYAIENPNKWEIDITRFKNDLRNATAKYAPGKLPFPTSAKPSIDSELTDFRFVKKLEEINIKPSKREDAIHDYIRAKLSQVEIINQRPHLETALTLYDDDVERMMDDEKDTFEDNYDASTDDLKRSSRNLYKSCIKRSHDHIPEVDQTPRHYRDGRIHHHVESSSFEWLINPLINEYQGY